MELQRHAFILIRKSQTLLKLTGEYDAGAHNDQDIHELIATMRAQLDELSARLAPADGPDLHLPELTSDAPFNTWLKEPPQTEPF